MTKKKGGMQRIGMECIFMGRWRSRPLTTPGNHEALNMLCNKLRRKGVHHNQVGRLIFEFKPGRYATVAYLAARTR